MFVSKNILIKKHDKPFFNVLLYFIKSFLLTHTKSGVRHNVHPGILDEGSLFLDD
jgi:hypothetical protein